MYLVSNVSKRVITISDLGLTIAPRQAFDLDAISLKGAPDKSKDLATSIKKGWIKIMKSDRKKRKAKTVASKKATPAPENMKQEIQKLLREELAKHLGQTQKTVAAEVDPRIGEILVKLTQIMNGQPISTGEGGELVIDDENSIDIKTLEEIHARAVERLAKDTKGSIGYKIEDIDGDIADQISELEDLL